MKLLALHRKISDKLNENPFAAIYFFIINMATGMTGTKVVGLLIALAVGGAIGVLVIANVQSSLNLAGFAANVNTTIANIFTQTYSAFNMWPIILIVVISVVIIAYVKLFR